MPGGLTIGPFHPSVSLVPYRPRWSILVTWMSNRSGLVAISGTARKVVGPISIGARSYGAADVFNLDLSKLLIIGVVAVMVLGPDKLPQAARKAGATM
jgi:mttA/Hcf106 family protein